jgi:hypothetical protein
MRLELPPRVAVFVPTLPAFYSCVHCVREFTVLLSYSTQYQLLSSKSIQDIKLRCGRISDLSFRPVFVTNMNCLVISSVNVYIQLLVFASVYRCMYAVYGVSIACMGSYRRVYHIYTALLISCKPRILTHAVDARCFLYA